MTIVSGGQAGVDRAALDFAIARGLPHRGWCPAGRKAEDGVIDSKYQLTETESSNYRARTVRNVRDSDATLILNLGELDGGSLETLQIAERERKPVRVVNLDNVPRTTVAELRLWLQQTNARALNIAGPRESKRPGIYLSTFKFLEFLWPLDEERSFRCLTVELREFAESQKRESIDQAKLTPTRSSNE